MENDASYKCKYCHKQYPDKRQATDCESRHLKPVSISGSWYHEGSTRPSFLDIKMHDGSEITYVEAFAKKFPSIVET